MFCQFKKSALVGVVAFTVGITTSSADNHEDSGTSAETPDAGQGEAEGAATTMDDPCGVGANDPCATSSDTGPTSTVKAAPTAPAIVLSADQFAIHGRIEANLSSDQVFKPFSVAPDIHYGVMPDLTVSLYHSGWGKTGFLGAGNGICLASEDNGCARIYDRLGLGAVYRFVTGPLELGTHLQLHINNLDPLFLVGRAGVKGQYAMGKMTIGFDPYIAVGLTKRDVGNVEEVIGLPVSVSFAATPKLNAFLMTGITGSLSGFADNMFLPIGIGAQFNINANMALGAAFQFNVIQKVGGTSIDIFDNRILNVFYNYAM